MASACNRSKHIAHIFSYEIVSLSETGSIPIGTFILTAVLIPLMMPATRLFVCPRCTVIP